MCACLSFFSVFARPCDEPKKKVTPSFRGRKTKNKVHFHFYRSDPSARSSGSSTPRCRGRDRAGSRATVATAWKARAMEEAERKVQQQLCQESGFSMESSRNPRPRPRPPPPLRSRAPAPRGRTRRRGPCCSCATACSRVLSPRSYRAREGREGIRARGRGARRPLLPPLRGAPPSSGTSTPSRGAAPLGRSPSGGRQRRMIRGCGGTPRCSSCWGRTW